MNLIQPSRRSWHENRCEKLQCDTCYNIDICLALFIHSLFSQKYAECLQYASCMLSVGNRVQNIEYVTPESWT